MKTNRLITHARVAGLFLLLAAPPVKAADGKAVLNNNKGNRLMAEERPDEAEEAYRKSREADPDEAAILYNLAGALARQGKIEEALDAYQKAAAGADPQIAADAHYNNGNLLMKMAEQAESQPPTGQQDPNATSPQELMKGAAQSYIQSLRKDPDHQEAKYNLENALKRLAMMPPPPPESQQNQDDQENSDEENQEEQNQDQQSSSENQEQEQQDSQQSPSESEQENQEQEQENAQPSEPQEPEEQDPQQAQAAQPEEKEPQPLDKEEAMRLLDRLAEEEQRNFRPLRGEKGEERRPEKDW